MSLMNGVFKQILDYFVIVFVDYILVCSKSNEEHCTNLCIILECPFETKVIYKNF